MDPSKKIVIVGAGVFGLSTALHLARKGYNNVHLFDSQDYIANGYKVSKGCVAASCDDNKVIRASYGGSKLYQDLAFEAISEWEKWNDLISRTPDAELPEQIQSSTKLWNNCGLLRLSERLEAAEERTQGNFPEELKDTQYRISDEKELQRALEDDIPLTKIDTFDRLAKGLPTDGYFDTTAGFALASEACSYALHLCRRAGVTTHFGPSNGIVNLVHIDNKVTGIKTSDGTIHSADLIIVACGGWTPTFLPSTEDLIETTAGSVVSFRLPPHRADLWDKFAPENFPVWTWNMTSYDREKCKVAGIFGLPRTEEGVVKLCFTGAEWTNYVFRSQGSGRLLSFPETGTNKIPEEAVNALKTFCEENLPDLLDLEPETFRLCWYSDSVDNSFLVDYVPGTEGLMVCSGGSGHGFKFLPVLGKHVVDVIEGRDTAYTRLFKWRDVPEDKRRKVEQGPEGWLGLDKQRMVDKRCWRKVGTGKETTKW